MKPVLDPSNRAELLGWLRPDTLVAFDYDGTLAPIVEDRERAFMRDETRVLLRRVAARYRTVVISGRARADLQRLTEGIRFAELVGNHGCEALGLDASWAAALVAGWERRLAVALRGFDGVQIENKRMSLAVHYRAAAVDVEAAIRAELERLDRVQVIGGKKVWNAVPAGLPHKGDALLRLCRIHRKGRYLFAGDDETDESVFSLDGPIPGMGIRIGGGASAAGYCIADQRGVDELLEILAAAAIGSG